MKSFFDRYYQNQITFSSNQIDAVVGFFRKRGFDEVAANSTSIVLLTQAKRDNVNPFKLIDTLKGLTDVQLSYIVAEVLNLNREKTSALGYKSTREVETTESRNILI
jgi:hypothetical protein